jgi:hypothetical protein
MRVFLIFITFWIAACDGRVRELYLKPPQSNFPPWSVASVVIPVGGSEDIPSIVSGVANELGLKKEVTTSSLRYGINYTGNNVRKSFVMTTEKSDYGYWKVTLFDWPEISRSDLSLNAEQRIRAALNGDTGGITNDRSGQKTAK